MPVRRGTAAGFRRGRGEKACWHIRVKDARLFYEGWTGLLLKSEVTVFAIRSESRSLKNIFDKGYHHMERTGPAPDCLRRKKS